MTPLRLLQVEDAEVDALIVRHELSCAGFDVFAVRVDSADALRRELTAAQWNLVISDYTMPGFTGAEALAIVRERDAHVPFIFISGTIGEEAAVAAMRNGAQDYIIRPDSCQWSNVNSPTRRFATNGISPISTSPTSRITTG